MHPDLFSIGPLTIHTYGLLVAIGIFVGITVATRFGKHEGINPQQVMDMGFMIIFSGIIGSRLLYVLMNISYYRYQPTEILKIWQGGLVFSGGIIGVVLTVLWYARYHKLPLWKLCDIWAPAAAIGQSIGRIGCFMAGCCYGKPTDLKWGVVFTNPKSLAPLNIPLHPTQIYSSLSGLIIFLILLLLYSKKKFEGQVFLWFLILHSTARLFIERFRGDDRGIFLGTHMSDTQLVAVVILVVSVVSLIVLKSRANKKSHDATQ
jgi:phosphatidylglycerol:prolipoprotein diacylglycerol transferase